MSGSLWQSAPPTLADRLSRELRSGNWTDATFAVAFASSGGVEILAPAIDRFRRDGGRLRVYVGVGRGGTSHQALQALLHLADEAWVVHNPARGVLYHPKVYLFESDHAGMYVVGSGNLTSGGLVRNVEAHVYGEVASPAHEPFVSLRRSIATIPEANKRLLDGAFLTELDDKGYLSVDPAPGDEAEGAGGLALPQPQLDGFAPVAPPAAPRHPQRARPAAVAPQPIAVHAVPAEIRSFVMRLGTRDVAQEQGYSREVYVPLAARRAQPAFWRWPDAFVDVPGRAGHYVERMASMYMQIPGRRRGVEDHRIFGYREKSEFRINTGLLPAAEGDLLVLTLSQRPGVEYELRIVSPADPDFAEWDAAADQAVPRSREKRYGYL